MKRVWDNKRSGSVGLKEGEGSASAVFEGELDPLDSISDQVFIVRNELGVKL